MSAQIPRPIGSIAFASALLLPGLGVSTPANTAQAACLTAPNSSAPRNSHWHYRTDRTQRRKCWYLSAPNQRSQQEAVQTAREAALAKPTQAAMHSHEGGTKLSNEDVEKLYAEFLEWNRRAKSPGK